MKSNKQTKQMNTWTQKEVEILTSMVNAGENAAEIAKVLGRPERSVSVKLYRLRKKDRVAAGSDKENFWRKEAERLSREKKTATHEKTAVEILVEQAESLAPKTYSPPTEVYEWPGRTAQSPQTAVLMLSDTHIGQVIPSDQTLGFGGYSFELFLNRLNRLQRSVFSILGDHTTTKISEIVVAMLGDMLHGNLDKGAEAQQVNTLFEQFYSAGHALSQFLRNLSVLAPVRVQTVVGNHPRWGTQRKMPTDNRYSNLDQFLYAYCEALTRDINRISWNISKQPFSLFTAEGYTFHASHGDHLRGGDRILGIPNHAIGRNVSMTTQLFARTGQPLPNYYLVGHCHRPITLPHASGEIIINGGFPGLDGYGLMEAFNTSYPSQKFFLVHKKFGRSATYDLRLDTGDKEPHKFKLPTEFLCR